MSDEKNELSDYEIRQIVGKYAMLSGAQRELLKAAFEIREGMDESHTKEMMKYLVLAKVIPQGTADSIVKRIFQK